MKKTLLVLIVTALFAVGATASTMSLIRPHGPGTQSLIFNDLGTGGGTSTSGTYMPGQTISFDISVMYSGYNSTGNSFWFEVNNALAGTLTITGFTYGTTFVDPTQPNPTTVAFNTATGASAGFMTETRDFGATINDFSMVPGPGTYFVGHITLTIAAGAPLGSFVLQSTVTSPHTSEVSSFDGTNFADNNLPAEQYMITIVPEPTTLALIGLTAVGGAIIAHRRRVLRG
jgi:hypothetical protein